MEMTIEEALEYFKNKTVVLTEEEALANTMAIKALERDPCEDSISRTEAMTEIQMNARRYTIAKEFGGFGQVEWSDNLISIKDALDILRKLPSFKQKPKIGQWDKDGACPFCGYLQQWDDDNYCGHCGAKLTKVNQDFNQDLTKSEVANEQVDSRV